LTGGLNSASHGSGVPRTTVHCSPSSSARTRTPSRYTANAKSPVLTSNASTTASAPRRDSSCARRARVRADMSSALIRPNRQLGSNTGSSASAPTSWRNAASLAAAT